MSTGVSDHQRSKGQGNSGKTYNRFPSNGPKDHHGGEHEEVDSWRNQHHQGYASSMPAASDPYMSSYYGASFQYPTTFGVNDGGPWSTNGGDMTFLGGAAYSAGIHDSAAAAAAGGHYNIDGMFSGGNGGAFGNFGGQPGFGYGFHGNGDYSTWGQPQPRKHYDDYYRDGMYSDERGVKMVEQGMGGLNLSGEKEHGGLKDLKEMMQQGGGGSKKTTWASIASQPAKPQSLMKKKPGMPPPPIIPGTWENKNGTVAKAPIAAPVQAPRPAAWERPKVPPPSGPPQLPASMPPPVSNQGPPSRAYQHQHQQPPINYMPPPPPHPHPMMQHSHSQHSHVTSNNHNSVPPPQPPPPQPASQQQPQYPDELKMKNEYNPPHFDLSADGARFFVIKSYSEDDIHRSIKYEIWCSTEHGNKRLDEAFREREGKGPIYLFFSVNSSGHFCGMAHMTSSVDYDSSSSVWSQDKWKGQFKVKWVYVKDVPNSALRHIRLENNENKPVTNSRDTQEVPYEKGKQVLKILHTFHHTTSIFDDFIHYEKRQEEEDHRRTTHSQQPAPPSAHSNHNQERAERERAAGGRGHHQGGHHDGGHHGPSNNHHPRDRDFMRDNPRDGRDHRGDRDGPVHMHGRMDRGDTRDHNNHRGGDRDRDHYGGGRDGRGDRDRDFHPRDRDLRGGRGGGGGGMRPPRN